MNYDIRKISDYLRNVHSRYYVDTNGIVYTSISQNTRYICSEGEKFNIRPLRQKYLCQLNKTNKMLCRIEEITNKPYFFLYDGTILQRLQTTIRDANEVSVCVITIDGNPHGNHISVARIVAACFIGEIFNKEVHHKDQNRMNNRVDNLSVMTFEEHRGKGNFNNNHNL